MNKRSLKKLNFLIAYGPTQEPIDPVRFISNYSTGVMGRYLVESVKKARHLVESIECPRDAQTAQELDQKLSKKVTSCDVLVMAAAVCDVRPASFSDSKIKKEKFLSIKFVKNPDILARLSKKKSSHQIFVGFALESENVFQNAKAKLLKKGLDFIVLQRVSRHKKPFGDKAIEAFIIGRNGVIKHFKSIKKDKLADFIIAKAASL